MHTQDLGLPHSLARFPNLAILQSVNLIMSSTIIVEQGKINKGGIVLSKPLLLPEGTEVRIQIEPIPPNVNTSTATDASEDFTNLPCFGMWADRMEMRDSVAWLKKEREKWQQRHKEWRSEE